MLSHYHGQFLNHSELARSFGISDKTVRHYIDILEGTFMIRVLQPWFPNISKRLVKSPKLYLRDSGIFHALQSIEDTQQLLTHRMIGASWEGYVIEEISKLITINNMYFYRTHNGSEVDLFWQRAGKNWGIEVKYGDNPGMTRSLANAADDLELEHLWIVYPGKREYPVTEQATVIPFERIRNRIFE
jgi:predicted AAA+ superfamily ATPase